jgi:hypothetical protein
MGHAVQFPPAGPWVLGAQHGIAFDYSKGYRLLMAGADPRGDNDALAK